MNVAELRRSTWPCSGPSGGGLVTGQRDSVVVPLGFQYPDQVRRDAVSQYSPGRCVLVTYHHGNGDRIEDSGLGKCGGRVFACTRQHRADRNPIEGGEPVQRIVAHTAVHKFYICSYDDGRYFAS
jgi:hypothetical protein